MENQLVNYFNKIGMIRSKNDPNYIFEEYKGYTIANHKNNVVGRDIDNRIIVYRSDEFPKHGFIVGLDDSKLSGRRKPVPVNIDDAKIYIDWVIENRQQKPVMKPLASKPQKTKGRKL